MRSYPVDPGSDESREGIEWPKVPQSSLGLQVRDEQQAPKGLTRAEIETTVIERPKSREYTR